MKAKRVFRVFPMLFVAAFVAAPLGWAQDLPKDLPRAAPEEVGMSSHRLARIGAWLESEVDKKKIPGAVLLVARQGKVVYQEAVGVQDPGTGAPMAKDSIFRIYSMTKPIATVAAMMLVEEGRLLLEAPVATYIPSFKDMKVAVEKAGPAGGAPTVEMEPARRPITVQDLMRHTSGLTYGFFGDSPAKRAYIDAKIGSDDVDNAEFADRIAAMPLGFQPGTTWDYSYSTDVLGRVVEVIEGKPLGAVLNERIFGPLAMADTAFHVSDASKQARIAEAFPDDRTIGTGISFYDPRVQGKFESGGGGLTGTAMDYARFAQMLLNGGELDGKRILSPATLGFMTSDHLGAAISKGKLYLPGAGYGFGLGFGVRTAAGESPFASSVGEYYWGGAGGTYFWADPQQDLFVVFMMQSPKNRVPYRSVLRNMVYAAIVD
ncbi:MAG TPA: serine hydrolase domain-containing protein [Burkholderiaceae bacterium]|nr:serine hydrolase domain-containing protein [Burkholderiaceae bacterium]